MHFFTFLFGLLASTSALWLPGQAPPEKHKDSRALQLKSRWSSDLSKPLWLQLPPTPEDIQPLDTITTPIDGVKLWIGNHSTDKTDFSKPPVLIIHGGLGYSAYFADVAASLLDLNHHVILVDRRGHGRSTYNNADFTYDQFASDTFNLLREKNLLGKPLNVVGWSDGAITTMAALLNNTLSPYINRAFLFGSFTNPSDTNVSWPESKIYNEFVARCSAEYKRLQPDAEFQTFAQKVLNLETNLPHYTQKILSKIDGKAKKVWVVTADHEEVINSGVADQVSQWIPGSELKTLKGVSHFAPLQNPTSFASLVDEWTQ